MLIALVLAALAVGADRARPLAIVRGLVADATTTAPIADVKVTLVEIDRSAITVADGRFEFTAVPPGTYTLTVSRIGYIFVRRRVEVPADGALELTVPLSEGTGTYRESVTVSGDSTPAKDLGVSSQASLGSAGLQELRGVVADDPMRAVQALPGVATGDDFQSEFSVRGSSFRHVGYVIDGTPTPLLLHSVRGLEDSGSIALINSAVLSRATLLAGAHPHRHGDWLGATLEFDTRDGSRDRTASRVAVSGTSASAVFEGPLGPGKRGSWLFSIRKSYLDWLVKKIEPSLDDTIGFTDAQIKLVYDVGSHQLQLLLIGGDATYRQENARGPSQIFRAKSQGGLASAAWRYTRNRLVLSQRLSFVENDFDDEGSVGQELGRGVAHSLIWRGDTAWSVDRHWTLEAGAKSEAQHTGYTLRLFMLNNQGRLRERAVHSFGPDTTIVSGWMQVSRRTGASGVSAGVRTTYDALDEWTLTSPWVLAERKLGPVSVRAGAGYSSQVPDLNLRESTLGPRLEPETAVSADLGVEHQATSSIRWQVNGFYRDDRRVLRRVGEHRLVDGELQPETPFPQFAARLEGSSRGVDVVLERRAASGLSGWLGYTFAHTRHHDRVSGEQFDGDFDQRHTVNLFLQQRLSYRMAVSLKFRYGTNFPLVGYFSGSMDDLRLGADRNRVRLPVYSRLDIRANRTFTFDQRRLTIFVELMNALGHDNIAQADGRIQPTLAATGFSQRLIPRVPSMGMLIEF
jgi:hypothetical protein